MNKNGPILIIEDDHEDQAFLNDAFVDGFFPNEMVYFTEATLAIKYIHEMTTEPFLILSDIKLPGMSGLEMLKLLKKEKHLQKFTVPILLFTTSENPKDIQEAFEHGANGYFVKPFTSTGFKIMINSIYHYWKHCQFA